MPWMLYRNWAGGVMGKTIRSVGAAARPIYGFGRSPRQFRLDRDFIGTIENILLSSNAKPSYVKFVGKLDIEFAAEVMIEKSRNSEIFWKDFYNTQMSTSELIVIKRSDLDNMEIEYETGEIGSA